MRGFVNYLVRHAIVPIALAGVSGCSMSDLVSNADLPTGVLDPKSFQTQNGAKGLYNQAVLTFAMAVGGGSDDNPYTYITGVLTDELEVLPSASGSPGSGDIGLTDIRYTPVVGGIDALQQLYRRLHLVRGLAQEAVPALRRYYPDAPADLQGHLFTLEAASEMLLAEGYCSGIPLSRLDQDGGYTLTRGFSTVEVLEHALTLLDSADLYISDSLRFQYFADVLRGRILLGLGRVVDAAAAVRDVPDHFEYQLQYSARKWKFMVPKTQAKYGDVQGGNGLPFGARLDPRVTRPSLTDSLSPIVFASGVEARMIQIEQLVAEHDPAWLVELNRLRTSCSDAATCPAMPPPGIGGVAGLALLTDPVSDSQQTAQDTLNVRLDLLFAERGYWFFLRGHRQGDLRRLVRNYQRPHWTVYPTGAWGNEGLFFFGEDVNLPVPAAEQDQNHLYHGCDNREA